MRVVHICQRDDPDVGGSLRVAEALVLEQRKAGLDVWLIFLYGEVSQIANSLAPFSVCLGLDSSRQAAKGIIALRKSIKRINPDIIHAHEGILWPRLVYLSLKTPVVVHAHSAADKSNGIFAWMLIRNTTDALISISEPTSASWKQAGFPPDKIQHISNGVDLNRFREVDRTTQQSLRRRLGLPENKKVLLWLGRVDCSMKGIDRIECIGNVLPDDVVLVVVGNGPAFERLNTRNADLLRAGRLIVTGSTYDPQDYFQAADIFIFTSHYEPFGLVILEAVACGLPLIAFPVDKGGGAIALLNEFGARWLQENAGREEVEATVRDALANSSAQNATRKMKVDKYDWGLKSNQIIQEYRILLGAPREVAGKAWPRVLVCQHGARHRYAIPRMLNEAGVLCAFYTDSSGKSNVGRFVRYAGHIAPASWSAASRWKIKGIPSEKTFSSDTVYFHELAQKIGGIRKKGIVLYHQRHQLLSSKMKKWGLRDANVVYSMYHEDLDFLRWAKDRGARSVVDVFISPITEEIMGKETALFPEWADERDVDGVELERRLWREASNLADLLICPSEWVAEGVRKISPEYVNKIRIVPYGCSIDYSGRVNEPVFGRVLFAGREALRKGLHYLAEAATKLKETIPALDVRIAGELPEKVIRHPLSKDLNFLGQLNGRQMREEFLTADMLVLPALSEGFAGVVAEAIGAGCPVIVTKEAGSPVINGREGLVVPSRNADALADAMQRMLTDRNFRSRCSENCLSQVPFYSEGQWLDRLVGVLNESLETCSAKPGEEMNSMSKSLA